MKATGSAITGTTFSVTSALQLLALKTLETLLSLKTLGSAMGSHSRSCRRIPCMSGVFFKEVGAFSSFRKYFLLIR